MTQDAMLGCQTLHVLLLPFSKDVTVVMTVIAMTMLLMTMTSALMLS